MALPAVSKDTVKARAERDSAFRDALLTEAVEQFFAGEPDTGKAVLHCYINPTIGLERLAEETGSSSKSLMRMLSSCGNPTANKFFNVLNTVQRVVVINFVDSTKTQKFNKSLKLLRLISYRPQPANLKLLLDQSQK